MTINYSNSKHTDKPHVTFKNTDPIYDNLNLHNCHHYHHYLQNIAGWKWKDHRLELLDIPKGLIEVLQNAVFTIEKIVDSEPSEIAEILGIDPYIGEIIYKETEKAFSKNKSRFANKLADNYF